MVNQEVCKVIRACLKYVYRTARWEAPISVSLKHLDHVCDYDCRSLWAPTTLGLFC